MLAAGLAHTTSRAVLMEFPSAGLYAYCGNGEHKDQYEKAY